MTTPRPRRRWLRYGWNGEPASWWAQPLYYGLAYLGISVVANTIAAFYWMSRGWGWFGSSAGKQMPILVVLLAVLAFVGLSRRPDR